MMRLLKMDRLASGALVALLASSSLSRAAATDAFTTEPAHASANSSMCTLGGELR
jgi:hypothetical protein